MSQAYQERLCLFLDILGFSSLVKNQECNVVLNVIREIKRELKSNKEYMNQIGTEPIATTFSDCIVLSLEPKATNIEKAANILVTATVQMLQDTYLNQEVSLRGGISYGELYHKSDGVFGPAMIKAYELESQFADWPRVIFDKSVIAHFKDKKGLPSIGFTNYGDGFWGVDCLNRIEDVLNREVQRCLDSEAARDNLGKLFKISEITQAKLSEHYGNPKVYSKYLMLNERVYSLLKKHQQIPITFDN
jgi:hypothetical protein